MCNEIGLLPWKKKSNHVESKNPDCKVCKNPHPQESLSITKNEMCRDCYRERLTNFILKK